jgi:predicted Zn-dependent protease with MMP-like domain
MKRISLKQFGEIVARVMETLPNEFKPYIKNLVVDVEEEPDIKTLRQMEFTKKEIARGDSLFGLYVPMQAPPGGEAQDLDWPDRLIIYKRPLEEEFRTRKRLMIEIRKTVIHELAHHFGYEDEDLEKFDKNPDPFGD